MHRIVLPDLVRLLARVGARRMGDQDLPVALAEIAHATGDAVRDGPRRAAVDASASVALHVFNATGDRDDGGVLGTRRTRRANAAHAHRPLLLKQPGQAWLRIALAADADALVRTSRGALSTRATAASEARLLSYRQHAPDVPCADAITTGLGRFASALSVDDACSLGAGDACVVQAEGRITASATLSWEALVAEVVPGLAGIPGREASTWMVELPADGSVALALAITDGVSVAIARPQDSGDDAFRVAVRRQRRSEREASAKLGIEAGLADPDAVARLVAGVLAGLLETPAEALRAIRAATTLRQVPARHRPAAVALAERLGIDDAEPLRRLRERLEDLDDRLMGRLQALARTRAAVVLEAEYRRLASDAVLLEAELTGQALRRMHPALLALDLPTVMADKGAGRQAVSLLQDRTLHHLRGWRIGASLGDWLELESAQRREDRFLERRRVDDDGEHHRREYLGATRYAARANGWSTAYGATFEAVHEGDRGSCALQLWWEEGRLRADAHGIARIVDDAVLWGIVNAGEAARLRERLHDGLRGVDRCRPRFERLLEADAARATLARIAATPDGGWALHMARALPFSARVAARGDCDTRAAVYAPMFTTLGPAAGSSLRRRIGAALREVDPKLAAREGRGDAPWTTWRVLRQAGLTPQGPRRAWQGWSRAANGLVQPPAEASSLAGPRAANQALAEAFARLRPAFEQPFTLRTLASLLAASADSGPEPGGARLTLRFERDGEPRSLLVAT